MLCWLAERARCSRRASLLDAPTPTQTRPNALKSRPAAATSGASDADRSRKPCGCGSSRPQRPIGANPRRERRVCGWRAEGYASCSSFVGLRQPASSTHMHRELCRISSSSNRQPAVAPAWIAIQPTARCFQLPTPYLICNRRLPSHHRTGMLARWSLKNLLLGVLLAAGKYMYVVLGP